MTPLKDILNTLSEDLERSKMRKTTAGTQFRLMGLMADINEVTAQLSKEVLERLRQEAALDVDADIDYCESSEQVMAMELAARGDEADPQRQLINEALGELSNVLLQIDEQLGRRHKDEEYVRLYEHEKRRYLSTGTARRARKTFEEWMYNVCYGTPTLDDINDYVTEKLLNMFAKGVFATQVEHIQRAKRYPDEIDFEQMDDEHKLRGTVYKFYAALRKVVDWQDGELVVNAARAGQHFYSCRHDDNAKAHRNAFLQYMHKIDMAQQELRKLRQHEEDMETSSGLNTFAPSKHLKVLLQQEWFEIHRTDKRYDQQWTEAFISALMRSEHGQYIAEQWSKNKRQDFIRGCVLGLLKDGGVIKGSMDSIARSAGVCENYRTLSRYMGQCMQEPYAEWVKAYLQQSLSTP